MQEMDDLALLREYAANNSETAFEELVSRRVGFVYSAALRQVRDAHLAEEITQAVFIILAQKAGRISGKTIMTGWFFRTTRFAALAQMRADAKRRQRELEVQMQTEIQSPAAEEMWNQISPLLDEALESLGEKDRQAVLLRFFENKSLAEVGNYLGIGEDTARKRVSRALEKLHRHFSKRGLSSTMAIFAGAISANSVQAAPVGLTKTISAVAIARGAAASGSTLTLIQGALKIMAWTKVKTITVAALVVIVGTSITTVAVKKLTQSRPVTTVNPGDWMWRPFANSFDQVPPIFLLQPSTLPAKTAPYFYFGKNGYLARGQTIKELITTIWSQKNSTVKLVFTTDLPENKFDFIVTDQPHWSDSLEAEINKRFNLDEQIETRDTGEVVVVRKVK